MANPYIEGDDEVVAEYDVFLSTGLAGDVHIFQFPLRPFDRPYEASTIDLQVTNGIAEDSTVAGAGLFGNVNTNVAGPTPTSRFHMNCTLDSYGSESFLHQDQKSEETQFQYEYALGSAPFISRSSYAIGLLTGDALHLCPVQSIQQFTPKVRSVVSVRSQVPAPPSATTAVGPTHSSAIGDTLGASTSGTSGGGNSLRLRDRELLRATRSYMLNSDAETAQQLVFYGIDSPESIAKKSQLACSTVTPSLPKAGAAQPKDTTTAYFPQDRLLDVSAEVAKKLVLRPGRHSKQEHIIDLIRSAQVITVTEAAEAMSLCGFPNMSEAEIVGLIREHAHYIHGVWVSQSPGVKISHPYLREIILFQFVNSENGTIKRSAVNSLITRNDPALLNSILAILTSIAQLSTDSAPEDRVWSLNKMASKDDISRFKLAFPQDAQLQKEYWERRRPKIQELLNLVNAGRNINSNQAGGSGGGGARLAPQQQPSVTSAAQAGTGAVRAAGALPGSANPTLQVGSQLDIWVSQIRSFVRTLFMEHGVVGKQYAKSLIAKNAREQRCPFFGATPEAMGTACRLELEGFTDSTFILQSANNKEIDTYRKYIVQAAKEKQQFAATDVVDRAQSLIESDFSSRGTVVPTDMLPIPKSVSQKIVTEIAMYQIGEKLWHLKRGYDGS